MVSQHNDGMGRTGPRRRLRRFQGCPNWVDAAHIYDRRMSYRRPSIADVAVEVGGCLAEGDEASALRLAFRCVELIECAPIEERGALLSTPPALVGDRRFDALLAAIAEYVCARCGILAPAWVEDEGRFLEQWWFVSGIKSLHADAIVNSPISFARRGVFITAGALAYA